jgi:hypothetical protein
MKLLFPILIFFIITPLIIFLSSSLLLSYSQLSLYPVSPSFNSIYSATDEKSLPFTNILGYFSTSDARVYIVKNYLKKYSSPLEPYSQNLINISDKYSLDYRLLVAIAQQESNLCKKIPESSHNCWGYGIYDDKITRFDNYPQAMDIVANTLKHKYIDFGFDTPEKIMAKYTPPSLEKGGPWAKGVNQFMNDLE